MATALLSYFKGNIVLSEYLKHKPLLALSGESQDKSFRDQSSEQWLAERTTDFNL